MKSQLRHILLAGLTVASAGLTMNAQTLTTDWTTTTDIPAMADARGGAGWDGKVYTNYKATSEIFSWDATGARTQVANGGGAGVGISTDGVGNLILVDGWAGAGSMRNLKVWDKETGTITAVAVTLPDGVQAARMDFIGRAAGDVTSETGGAVFLVGQDKSVIGKIYIANSQFVAEKSKALPELPFTCDNMAYVQPLTDDPASDDVAVRTRTQKNFYRYDGTAWVAYPDAGAVNTTGGGDVVTLNGTLYTIEPAGATPYKDGFQIVDRTTNEVVATHEETASVSAVSAYPFTALSVQKIDEYTARIYQYHQGAFAAQYTFSLPKPMPKLEARNAYAYDIKVAQESDNYVVSYRLSAPAESAAVRVTTGGTTTKDYPGTTIAEYGDEAKTTVNNLNTVTIPASEISQSQKVEFGVVVNSATVTEPTVWEKQYRFYHPAGVAIDNNTDSPYFGRLYMTEAMPVGKDPYLSKDDGQGLYVFDQMLNPVKNSEGGYAFKGGQTFQSTFDNGSTSYDPRKVRVAKDGRVFLSGQNSNGIALWEVNPDDLNAAFTPVIKGTADADTYEIKTAGGDFMAAPNVSLAVKGEGENLQLLMLSTNKSGIGFSYGGYRLDEYDLGTATEWTTAPSRNIAALSQKYTITHTNTTAIYDNEGGIWYVNSRSTTTAEQPAVVHINAAGVEDYKIAEGTSYYGGGGVAFNSDYTMLAIAGPRSNITVYEVSKDAEGKPVLTEKYHFATTIGGNTNDIAWDIADNMYIVGNSGEWLKAFSLPRESGEVYVAAPSQYNIEPAYPAEIYLIGSVTNPSWNPSVGLTMTKVDGTTATYKAEITTTTASDNIGIVTVLGADSNDWDTANANRYGFAQDNARVTIGETMPIVKGSGAIMIGAVGTFDVTVDLAAMTILVEGEPVVEYPDALYMIGTIGTKQWDPSVTDYKLNKTAEGVYTIESVTIESTGSGAGGFCISATPGANSTDWATFNAHRYGPATTDYMLTDGVKAEILGGGDTSYAIAPGEYKVTVDLVNGEILAENIGGSVDATAAVSAKAVGGNGEIRIVGEAESVSIYTISGQAIAINSRETTFSVATGVYVVVIDGKTSKVAVK